MASPILSIIVLNYNTSELTINCVDSIIKNTKGITYEIIVIDNGSTEVLSESKKFKLIKNKSNLGFAGGNNSAREFIKGQFVLFLNSDTEVYKDTIKETVSYLISHKEVGALTCKTLLPNGKLDKDARRSFPTPWVALTHFTGLDRIMPTSRIFAQYWYGYKDPNEIQEVEALQGAYFLTRRSVLDEVNWFSEDYFLDGEDIDLSWKIHEAKYKIIYYPKVSILHIKKASKKKRSLRSAMAGVNSMEIFYKKHLWSKYPIVLNLVVLIGIYIMKILRFGTILLKR